MIETSDAPGSVGSYDNAVDAWKALDELDLAEVEDERAVAA